MLLSERVTLQTRAESVTDVLSSLAPMRPIQGPVRLFHVLNPYPTAEGDLAESTQLATLRSVDRALAAAAGCTVRPVVVTDARALTPRVAEACRHFSRAANLVRNVSSVVKFPVHRPLPLVFDVLASGVAGIDAPTERDFIIFTNMDICLMPHFYQFVTEMIQRGIDAMTINRRVLPLSMLDGGDGVAASEYGIYHGGFDCFVFPAASFGNFTVSTSCIGVGWVMRPLLHNLVVHSGQFVMWQHIHATYHFGDDEAWQDPSLKKFNNHNRREARRVFGELAGRSGRLIDFAKAHPEPSWCDVSIGESAPRNAPPLG